MTTTMTTLDPNDPFDAVIIQIVETNRRKRADYARDGDVFSNFKTSSALLGIAGFGPADAALFNIAQKLARLQSLRTNGRMHDTANETVVAALPSALQRSSANVSMMSWPADVALHA